MHHIYTTKAIIIRSIPIGEANKYYFLLTEDLGFIRATAQGVRLDKSKLKGHLQDFCFVEISLVKGKQKATQIDTHPTLKGRGFLDRGRNLPTDALSCIRGRGHVSPSVYSGVSRRI